MGRRLSTYPITTTTPKPSSPTSNQSLTSAHTLPDTQARINLILSPDNHKGPPLCFSPNTTEGELTMKRAGNGCRVHSPKMVRFSQSVLYYIEILLQKAHGAKPLLPFERRRFFPPPTANSLCHLHHHHHNFDNRRMTPSLRLNFGIRREDPSLLDFALPDFDKGGGRLLHPVRSRTTAGLLPQATLHLPFRGPLHPSPTPTDIRIYLECDRHGNRLAGVTSDGGFVIWELPECCSVRFYSSTFSLFVV